MEMETMSACYDADLRQGYTLPVVELLYVGYTSLTLYRMSYYFSNVQHSG